MATDSSATPSQDSIEKMAGASHGRREWERRDYNYAQAFLPVDNADDQEIPQLDRFSSVQCVDLSEGGVAFLWSEKPTFVAGLVALGSPPKLIMMRVTVVNVVERDDGDPLELSLIVAPDVTSLQLPAGVAESGEELKIEILVREESGNQTATESCFEVN